MKSLNDKTRDWNLIVSDIERELGANINSLSSEKVSDIKHYLSHGELSMAFEYLYLEIIESKSGRFTLGLDRVIELAILFGLDSETGCMVDHKFWEKLSIGIGRSHLNTKL